MTAETYITVPQGTLTRCVAFVRRAVIKAEADSVSAYAWTRAHGEDRLCAIPVDAESDPDDIGRELAVALSDAEECERFRLSASHRDTEVQTITLPGRRARTAAPITGEGGKRANGLLNGDARDTLLTAAIRGYADLVASTNRAIEARDAVLLGTIDRLSLRNAELETHALEVARQHVQLAREDREGKAAERLNDVKAKALEDTAGQIQRAIPLLTAGVAKWAGVAVPGGGPPGPVADALRELGAEQVIKLPAILTEAQAVAVVRAWEYVKRGGGEGGAAILVAIKQALRDLTGEQIAGLQAILTAKQQAAVVRAWEETIKEGGST